MKQSFKLIIDSLKKGVPLKKQTSTTYVEMRSASQNNQEDQTQAEAHEILAQNRQIKPMFAGKSEFNNNAFQQMFMHLNGTPETRTQAMQVYEEPQALVSGLQPFTEIDDNHKVKQTDNLSSLAFASYQDGFDGKNNP